MIKDPFIIVECDVCGEEYEKSLTRTGKGWDDRGLEESLRRTGWLVNEEGTHTICPDCVLAAEEMEEEEEPEMEGADDGHPPGEEEGEEADYDGEDDG